jgi:glutathione S-transferase
MAPTLYTFFESGNSYKVVLLAALLDVELDIKEVDYFGGELKSPEYLAINPRGQVPALVDGDRVFRDSAAILVYLAGTRSSSTFWSHDAVDQAQIVDWLSFAAGIVQAGVCSARGITHFRPKTSRSQDDLAEAKSKGHKSLAILEKQLENQEWLVLGRPTIADVSVFVYVALAPMGGISLESYPAVKGWIARVKGLKGFVTMPGLDDPNYRVKK